YKLGDAWRLLEPGMVLTIEPGIYVAPDTTGKAKAWRGIGIRIEDDVVVTRDGCDVLTAALPADPDEVERAVGTAHGKAAGAHHEAPAGLRGPDRRRRPRRLGACGRARRGRLPCRARRIARSVAARAAELRCAGHGARERVATDSRCARRVARARSRRRADSDDTRVRARPVRHRAHRRARRRRRRARLYGREPAPRRSTMVAALRGPRFRPARQRIALVVRAQR